MTIGDRIKKIRKNAQKSQEEFGKVFGIVKSTVSLYESGKSCPNDQIKLKICEYFDIPLDKWQKAIDACVPAKFAQINHKAFMLGRGEE